VYYVEADVLLRGDRLLFIVLSVVSDMKHLKARTHDASRVYFVNSMQRTHKGIFKPMRDSAVLRLAWGIAQTLHHLL
jgi:pantothenate kinase